MAHDGSVPPDLKAQARTLLRGNWPGRTPRAERYDRILRRIYLGLLVFIVVVGLPIVGVPPLRQRLQLRAKTLCDAVLARRPAAPPVLARIGGNTDPFPKEYEIPLHAWTESLGTAQLGTPVFRVAGQAETAPGERPEQQDGVIGGGGGEAAGGEATVEFRQGDREREAYELVLKNSESMAGLVQGKEPSLRFVKWAAAMRDEDTYWVDVAFTRSPEGTEARYVWQVTLSARKVTPLSALARSLQGP